MRFGLVALALTTLAGCGESEPSAAEKARQDAADIAAVKAAQVPPPTPVTPEPIRYPDIEKHDLFGAGCNFAHGGSIAPVMLALSGRAYMKIDGELVAFAADAGSASLPLDTKAKYTAGSWSFVLDIAEAEARQSGGETVDYPAHFILRNDRDQIVFETNGTAQCGS